MQVLLIEGDEAGASALAGALREHGTEVVVASGVRDALAIIDARRVDAVVLDRILPEIDGITALRWLRGGNVTMPIVMLSTLSRSVDKVAGLNAGADDYLVRPVDARELDARLRALLRGRQWAIRPPDMLRVGGVSVSRSAGRAWGGDRPLRLSDIEFRLLVQLLSHAGTVMTRATLVERVWGHDVMPETNIVDVHVSKLRRKIVTQTGSDPIETVRGAGYMIDG